MAPGRVCAWASLSVVHNGKISQWVAQAKSLIGHICKIGTVSIYCRILGHELGKSSIARCYNVGYMYHSVWPHTRSTGLYDLTTGTAEKIEKCSRPDDSFEAVLRGEMEKVGWMYCPRSDALASLLHRQSQSAWSCFNDRVRERYCVQRQSSCAGAWLWRKEVKQLTKALSRAREVLNGNASKVLVTASMDSRKKERKKRRKWWLFTSCARILVVSCGMTFSSRV